MASEPARAHTIYLRYLSIILYLYWYFFDYESIFVFFFCIEITLDLFSDCDSPTVDSPGAVTIIVFNTLTRIVIYVYV